MTVDEAINEIVGSLLGKLTIVGLSVVRDHTNPDVIGSVRKGLGYVGVTPAAFIPVDADLAGITGWNVEKLLDAATLETCYKIEGSAVLYDQKIDTEEKDLSKVAEDIRAMIRILQDKLAKPYGPNQLKGQVGSPPAQPIPNDPFDPCRSRGNPFAYPYPR